MVSEGSSATAVESSSDSFAPAKQVPVLGVREALRLPAP
jgi:hypothetical protein